jgi:hypothetical protein
MECDTVQSDKSLSKFRRDILTPASGLKNSPGKQQAEHNVSHPTLDVTAFKT